jgi:uncharacterized membrane protein YfcA
VRLSELAAISSARIAAAAPLGFLIGLSLGTLGGGGSILAVPALVYGAGEGAKAATTTSLVVVGTTALVGMVGHYRAGRVRLWSGLGFGLVGIGGSFVGSLLNRAVPGDVLLLAFSGLILVAAWRMHSRRADTTGNASLPKVGFAAGDPPADVEPNSAGVPAPSPSRATTGDDIGVGGQLPPEAYPDLPVPGSGLAGPVPVPATPVHPVVRVVLAGTAVGFLTGFFGVGGGFVIVPALVLALGYDMPIAVGTSLLVIAVNSAEGLAFRLSAGGVDWGIALPFTVAGIIGVLLGNRIAGRVPAAKLTRWFIWLLLAVAAYTATQSLIAL